MNMFTRPLFPVEGAIITHDMVKKSWECTPDVGYRFYFADFGRGDVRALATPQPDGSMRLEFHHGMDEGKTVILQKNQYIELLMLENGVYKLFARDVSFLTERTPFHLLNWFFYDDPTFLVIPFDKEFWDDLSDEEGRMADDILDPIHATTLGNFTIFACKDVCTIADVYDYLKLNYNVMDAFPFCGLSSDERCRIEYFMKHYEPEAMK